MENSRLNLISKNSLLREKIKEKEILKFTEEIKLDEKEKSEFNHSIEAVKKLWEAASAIDPDLKK